MRLAGLIPLGLVLAGCAGSEQAPAPGPPAAADAGPGAHFTRDRSGAVGDGTGGGHVTARLLRPARLRAAPGGRALARLSTRTEFGSPRVLAVVRRRGGWLRVIASELGNRERGWIPASGARLGATSYSIHVDRSARRAVLKRGERAIRRLPVAVGRPGNETPLGEFAVTDKLRPADPTSPYGCCAIALSGHQRKLVPGWPGGDRLAIHGTPQPQTIGRRASLGCLRARARDLRALMKRVPLGTRVFIRA